MRLYSVRLIGISVFLLAVAACAAEPREVPYPGSQANALAFAVDFLKHNGGIPRDAVLSDSSAGSVTPIVNGHEGKPQVMSYTFVWRHAAEDPQHSILVQVGAMRALGGGPVERRVLQYIRQWGKDVNRSIRGV